MAASQDRKLSLNLNFGVFHGRVIQIMEGKIPIVHGRGYSIDGWGGTRIETGITISSSEASTHRCSPATM